MFDKPYKSRFASPAISMYLISSDTPEMESLSCMWCKKTIADVKGQIDAVISTPMPTTDFDMAVNIRCKLCKQNYRLLINSNY